MERWYGHLIIATAVSLGSLYAASFLVDDFRILYAKFIPGPVTLHPVLLFIMGATFGLALTCLVAPTSFLHSKTGVYYLQVLGVQNIVLFRVKCLLACALFATVTYMFYWMAFVEY